MSRVLATSADWRCLVGAILLIETMAMLGVLDDAGYICTQLLGIDLRAVKYLEAQGCDRRTSDKLTAADRERIQACLDQYARFVVTKATDAVLGHVVGTDQKVQ